MLYVDWFMLFVAIFSVVILIIITVGARMPKKIYGNENKASIYAIKLRNSWLCSSIVCLFIHYWCILYSILLTLIVLYLSCFETTSQNEIKVRVVLYSALSLFTNVLPYVINLKKLSSKYRSAYMSILPMTIEDPTLAKVVATAEVEISQAFIE